MSDYLQNKFKSDGRCANDPEEQMESPRTDLSALEKGFYSSESSSRAEYFGPRIADNLIRHPYTAVLVESEESKDARFSALVEARSRQSNQSSDGCSRDGGFTYTHINTVKGLERDRLYSDNDQHLEVAESKSYLLLTTIVLAALTATYFLLTR